MLRLDDVVGKTKSIEPISSASFLSSSPKDLEGLDLLTIFNKIISCSEAEQAMNNLARDIKEYQVKGKEVFEKLIEKIQFDKKFFFDQRVF